MELNDASNFEESTVALNATKCPIQDVEIHIQTSFLMYSQQWDHSEREKTKAFIRALGGLKRLKSLSIFGSKISRAAALPLQFLTEILRNNEIQLERLVLYNLLIFYFNNCLFGTSLQDFLDLFEKQTALQEISMVRSQFGAPPPYVLFQDWCEILSLLPALQRLRLVYQRILDDDRLQFIKTTTYANLVHKSSLRFLEISNFDTCDRYLDQLLATQAEADFNQNETRTCHLEELWLSCRQLRLRGCKAIARFLPFAPALHTLHLESQGTLSSSKEAPVHMDDECVNVLARALTPLTTTSSSSQSLSKLQHFWLDGTSVTSLAPFVEMMRANCALETFKVIPGTDGLEQDDQESKAWKENTEIQMLCKLNAAGRYHLLHPDHCASDSVSSGSSCHQHWINALIETNDDVNCSFYLLSLNPLICNINK